MCGASLPVSILRRDQAEIDASLELRALQFGSSLSAATVLVVHSVALALKEQVLPAPEKVPSDEDDRQPDGILTADGLVTAHEPV